MINSPEYKNFMIYSKTEYDTFSILIMAYLDSLKPIVVSILFL